MRVETKSCENHQTNERGAFIAGKLARSEGYEALETHLIALEILYGTFLVLRVHH